MDGELRDYRAYEEQLGEQLEGFVRLRRQVRFFPVFALLTGVPVWLWTKLVFGVAAAAAWLIVWSSTLYITSMRSWQYAGERKRIRGEIAELERQSRVTSD